MSKAKNLGMPSRPVRDRVRRENPCWKKGKRGEEMKIGLIDVDSQHEDI